MHFRQKLTLSLLLYIALCLPLSAQLVDIPDPNLRAAVREALNLPPGVPLTVQGMRRLTDLGVGDRGMTNLTGLEYARNLTYLGIHYNPITDLGPIAGLTHLDTLYMWGGRFRILRRWQI